MWYKFLIELIIVLYIIYLLTVLCQLYGVFQFTNRKITFKRMITPFYYWIVSTDELKKNKNESNKN